MWQIPVYSAEIADGIADKIRACSSVSYASLLQITDAVSPEEKEKIVGLLSAKATNQNQLDLHYLKSLLVSTGCNLNDDVFLREEVWAARHTPEDKPVNYEHDQTNIIGHMTACYAVDGEGKTLSNETATDKLPNEFHIISSAVLYKVWADTDKQKWMNSLIASILDGKKYVSMEALFKGFDYAVMDGASARIIARNDKTSFLTKHLRIYGGSGEYNGQKVGRVLRNIVFSGKGIVAKPANPKSDIIDKSHAFVINVKENIELEKVLGYNIKTQDNKESKLMSTELELVKAQNDKLEVQIKVLTDKNIELANQLKDLDSKAVTAKLDNLNSELKVKADKITELESKVSDSAKAMEASVKELTETKATLAEVNTKLTKIEADKKLNSALSALKEKGYEDAEAKSLVEALNIASMSDEQIVKVLAGIKLVKTPGAPVNPKTSEPGIGIANPLEQNKVPENDVTGKGLPTPKKSDASVDVSALDKAVITPEPNMSIASESELESVRAEVLKYFDVEESN